MGWSIHWCGFDRKKVVENVKAKTKKSKNTLKPTAAELVSGLIISVGEARKLLGTDADKLSDDEIALLTISLANIAPNLIELSTIQRKHL